VIQEPKRAVIGNSKNRDYGHWRPQHAKSRQKQQVVGEDAKYKWMKTKQSDAF
jgi:hypothetical protein